MIGHPWQCIAGMVSVILCHAGWIEEQFDER